MSLRSACFRLSASMRGQCFFQDQRPAEQGQVIRTETMWRGVRYQKVTLCPVDLFRILLFLYFCCGLGPDVRIAFPAICLRFGLVTIQEIYSAFNETVACRRIMTLRPEVLISGHFFITGCAMLKSPLFDFHLEYYKTASLSSVKYICKTTISIRRNYHRIRLKLT